MHQFSFMQCSAAKLYLQGYRFVQKEQILTSFLFPVFKLLNSIANAKLNYSGILFKC